MAINKDQTKTTAPPDDGTPIVVRASVLAGIARFASHVDERRHMSMVVVRPNEFVACNGDVLVRIAREDGAGPKRPPFGISRHHIELAVAGPIAIKRDLSIYVKSDHVEIEIMRDVRLHVPLMDVYDYPPIDNVMPEKCTASSDHSPLLGIGVGSGYLADIHALVQAGGWENLGLRVDGWGSEKKDPLLLSAGPMRVVLMPVIPVKQAW